MSEAASTGAADAGIGALRRTLGIANKRGLHARAAAKFVRTAGQFDAVAAVTAAAEGCDAVVATGMMPAAAGVRSAAEKLGIRYVYATFQQLMLPSPRSTSRAAWDCS